MKRVKMERVKMDGEEGNVVRSGQIGLGGVSGAINILFPF